MNPGDISKQDLKNVVMLGAKYLLDGTVEQREWVSRMNEQSGPSIERAALLARISRDDILIGIRHHAEKISSLLRAGRVLAASSWVHDYANVLTREIEHRGHVVLEDDDIPDGWEDLCKHPAVLRPGSAWLAWVICCLLATAFLYLLFTRPRILIDTRYGVAIGIFGMFTLVISGLILYAVIGSKVRKRIRHKQRRAE